MLCSEFIRDSLSDEIDSGWIKFSLTGERGDVARDHWITPESHRTLMFVHGGIIDSVGAPCSMRVAIIGRSAVAFRQTSFINDSPLVRFGVVLYRQPYSGEEYDVVTVFRVSYQYNTYVQIPSIAIFLPKY